MPTLYFINGKKIYKKIKKKLINHQNLETKYAFYLVAEVYENVAIIRKSETFADRIIMKKELTFK